MVEKNFLLKEIVIDFLDDSPFEISCFSVPLGSYGLAYEYVTLKSNNCSETSQLFQWFRGALSNCNSGNEEELIMKMLSTFRSNKNKLSPPMQEYVLIDGIFAKCYHLEIKNSQVVLQVLNVIYECWSSFGCLHFATILRPEQFQSLKKQKQREGRLKVPDVLTFYLEHARRLKLEYNRKRMIDVSIYSSMSKAPVFVAAEVWSWKCLLRYLQYGARFEDVSVNPDTTQHGVSLAIVEVLRNLIRHLWYQVVEKFEEEHRSEDQVQEYCRNVSRDVINLCKTFTIILRAVRRISQNMLRFVIKKHHGEWIEEVDSGRTVSHSAVNTLLPTLKKRCGCLVELKHSCRWIIRKRLNENWQLPCGIQTLPIPKYLKKYLNLLSD